MSTKLLMCRGCWMAKISGAPAGQQMGTGLPYPIPVRPLAWVANLAQRTHTEFARAIG